MSTFLCGRYRLDLSPAARPQVMGILNITPDSFSDGGRFFSIDAARRRADQMLEEGVDIIDIGGESTRPGAAALSVDEELERVIPVVEALADCGKPLSIDTLKPGVMRASLAAGADMINDVNGLRAEGAIDAVASSQCGLCVMHMQRDPATMQQSPHYGDVVVEVQDFLLERCQALLLAGVGPERICVDPGFGFGKSVQHNLGLLNSLDRLRSATGLPVLAGLSRKSVLGHLTGRPVEQRMAASIAAAVVAAERGARIIRVHDVAETVDALKVWHATRSSTGQA